MNYVKPLVSRSLHVSRRRSIRLRRRLTRKA